MHLSSSEIRQLFHYDPHTGVLTQKNRDRGWFCTDYDFIAWNRRYGDKEAGSIRSQANGHQCRVIHIKRKRYYAHRIIWTYMTGLEPPKQIDHINGDATDNRWQNLRDGTKSNRLNLCKYKNNKSGVTGVHRHKGKWRAVVSKDGEVYRLGSFESLSDAEAAVLGKRLALGMFTKDHGIREAPYR